MRSQIGFPLLRSVAALILSLAFAATAAAQPPRIVFSNGERPLARLPIGDSLMAGLIGAAPGVRYRLVLTDGHGKLVAATTGKADAAGRLGPLPLWLHSGVVGCDVCAAAEVRPHRYLSFAAAAAALDGHDFLVSALGPAGGLVGSRILPLFASGEERPYFADADGCPRFTFAALEPVYLAFENPRPKPHRLVLAANEPSGIQLGQLLADPRGGGQPPIFDPGQPTLVWTPSQTHQGTWVGVVGELDTAVFTEGYNLIGPGGPKSMAGLSITVDTIHCPPPGTPP